MSDVIFPPQPEAQVVDSAVDSRRARKYLDSEASAGTAGVIVEWRHNIPQLLESGAALLVTVTSLYPLPDRYLQVVVLCPS